jgi:phosphohistidine phosphatase
MKTLLLMRHAKSSWKNQKLADHERPLNKRGKKDAPLMGQMLKERHLVPQQIISSTAIRARQTTETVVEHSHYKGEVLYLDRLYLAEADEYIKVLREVPDSLDRVMLVGHNPGLETLLQVLTGEIQSLPTAVIAQINLPIDHWVDISNEVTGEIAQIWLPREVRKEEVKDKDKKKKDK